MSEPIDITKPVWTKRGGVVTDIRQISPTHFLADEEYEGEKSNFAWFLNGEYSPRNSRPYMDLTNTPPAKAAAGPEPEPAPDLAAENATLRAENEHLKKEVARMHAEYRTLWNMTKKIEGRRATSR